MRVTTYSCDNPNCFEVVEPRDTAEWWSVKVEYPKSLSKKEFRWTGYTDDELYFCSLACLMTVTTVMHDRYSD